MKNGGQLLCKLIFTFSLLTWGVTANLYAQSVLYGFSSASGTPGEVISVDVNTCVVTTLASNLPPGNFTDFVLMPNGTLYYLGFSGSNPAVQVVNTGNNTWTTLATVPGPPQGGGMLELSPTTILVMTLNVVAVFDITTNSLTVLGSIPGFNATGEIFLYNGQIYVTQAGGGSYPDGTYILNLANLSLTPVSVSVSGVTSVCNQVIDVIEGIEEIDINTGNTTPLCNLFLSSQSGFASTATDPFNNTGPLCNCSSQAGTFLPPNVTVNACAPNNIPLQYANNAVLDPDDALVFVLVQGNISNNFPNNIIAVYNNPTAVFIPGITVPGTVYSVWAIAGNALGAGVDYSDPCLSISTAPRLIRWRPSPTVTFNAPGTTCSVGCSTITATFTGAPPFTLTYQTLINGVVQTTVTQTFNALTGNIQICPPVGYAGPFDVAATLLLDNFCTCGP
jgi:hypothetical protein